MSTQTSQAEEQKTDQETESVVDDKDELNVELNGSATPSTDNVGGSSVEINIDELVAEFEAEVKEEAEKGTGNEPSARQRLDDMLERKRAAKDLDVIDEFPLDS